MRPDGPIAPPIRPVEDDRQSPRAGFLLALCAFLIWGFMPLYFVGLRGVPPWEVVAHRVLWAVPVAILVQWWRGRLSRLPRLWDDRRTLIIMVVPAALISINWGVYIHAVDINRASEAALGYYLTPILNVAMGAVLLRERLDRLQQTAIAIVAAAVLWRIIGTGAFPWIGLCLSGSFAIYGFMRKTLPVGPVEGFLVEVLWLSPFALAIVGWYGWHGTGTFGDGVQRTVLLVGAGAITAAPLILFAFGARALELSTVGLMGYIGPSLILVLSVTVMGESVSADVWITFVMIWIGLAIYSVSALGRAPESAPTSVSTSS